MGKSEIFEILEGTYGFEPMPEELNLYVTQLNLNEDPETAISWEAFQAGLIEIRETVNKVSADAPSTIAGWRCATTSCRTGGAPRDRCRSTSTRRRPGRRLAGTRRMFTMSASPSLRVTRLVTP